MAGYQPLSIVGPEQGLVQQRQDFLLVDDAFPRLENAFIFREQTKRKQGYVLLGRLRRKFNNYATGAYATIFGTNTYNLFSRIGVAATEPDASVEPGSSTAPIVIVFPAAIGQTLTDDTGTGVMTVTGAGPIVSATIDYSTGIVSITAAGVFLAPTSSFTGAYFPALPAMGVRTRETDDTDKEETIFFDTKYAYIYSGTGFQEFIISTQWTGSNSDFFWSTNYWTGDINQKIFWVTSTLSATGDPIRYTNSSLWIDFSPTINAAGDKLQQCLAMLPFRGRMMTFNTREGATLLGSTAFFQRIRWAAIGTPFSDVSAIVTVVSVDAWRDDIRGKGGYLDIPTSEAITAVGFVRDNLVIYCERSTWQLRYTGNQVAPFQIEKVNTELGALSTFSAVTFDTSLVGIGNQGVVECDSFSSKPIDIKIVDLVYQFSLDNNGQKRVHGIRDIRKKLAYWTYPDFNETSLFPNKRLVYNYENGSWAIFTDSLTCLGIYQPANSPTWETTPIAWEDYDQPWNAGNRLLPLIAGGNQQGFVEILDSQVSNDPSLFIKAIVGNATTATTVTSPNHNLATGAVIKISGISTGGSFSVLNDTVFGIVVKNDNEFYLYRFDSETRKFTAPSVDGLLTYIGGGSIAVREGFSILSKKFEYMKEGQKIQLGYIDILMSATSEGEVTLNVYNDYLSTPSVNNTANKFFNSIVPTSAPKFTAQDQSKYWHRVYCPSRANFIQLEWTMSDEQLNGSAQESEVQIDAMVIWKRPAGRMTI